MTTVVQRLQEPRRFLQVLSGPRQVGKTTIARQALARCPIPAHSASADDPGLRDASWLRAQWEIGRLRARQSGRDGAILVLDEIQKISAWSDVVKLLWDEDTAAGTPLRVVLLGSAQPLVAQGLTESLTGRFELMRIGHWTFPEIHDAFGWDLDRFLYFGGYPGAAPLAGDRGRWARYILDSLVETTLARDVLLLTRVDKPALLRLLFRLACDYSGQVLPYQRMIGQLQDAGNTTTLAHYLELLAQAGLVLGLPKYSGARVRQRGSSPKLLALNTALLTAHLGTGFAATRQAQAVWGRIVETAIGAHLVSTAAEAGVEVSYWRERNVEVDFVLRRGADVMAIEVTSGRRKDRLPGLRAFTADHPGARALLVGGQGIGLTEFLRHPVAHWL
ncbi:MAG: ATP-binding protein [Candidatus Dormibacteria bacterium]